MRPDPGLAFVFSETAAFLRQAWWLAMVAALPSLAYVIFWHVPVPWNGTANLWIVSGLTALAYVALSYWITRYIALGHDISAAVGVNVNSARTFLPYGTVAFSLIWLTPPVAAPASGLIAALLQLLPLLILYLLAPWGITAPSGSSVIGPVRSLQLLVPHLGWAICVFILLELVFVLLFACVGMLGWLLLPASVAISIAQPGSLAGAITRAMGNTIGDVLLISATYALALRTGVRVGGAERLRIVFE